MRDEAESAVARGSKPARRRRSAASEADLPAEVVEELGRAGGGLPVERLRRRLADAAAAFQAERYRDARALLRDLAEKAPAAPAVRELYGLTLYRLGRWQAARRELLAYEDLTGSLEQHPVLADCERALGRTEAVLRRWDELRQGGVGVEVLTEGRIVTAGALADAGRMREGIALLEEGPVDVGRPREHHIRLWYALAALYERAGEIPRARELFRQVAEAAPHLTDAQDRRRALG